MSEKEDSENKSNEFYEPFCPMESNNQTKLNKQRASVSSAIYPRVQGLLKTWADVSQINYMSAQPLNIITSVSNVLRRRSIGLPSKDKAIEMFNSYDDKKEEVLAEQFPMYVSSLMHEDNLWGCFYIFPELYADVYSPVVQIREIQDVPEIEGGVLTRDLVTACLTYLKRNPILGEYVYIKLNLASKQLTNIDVLQHYKYLVYLDLSCNLLEELTVLSNLPYLQYLSVAYNSLSTVLNYETAQWFLTEVHYKFNSVKRINNLSAFWSITILDLSHNNIKHISGLQNLMYLRRLDLSFNHIQRLENLNNLRLLWLDLSYNNISSFESGDQVGLWTLNHLEFLNLNENNLTSLKMFADCTRYQTLYQQVVRQALNVPNPFGMGLLDIRRGRFRLRELHARNNRFYFLLELAVYMKQLRRLVVLDLRENPLCNTPGYKVAVINSFPLLLTLDATELDPVEQRSLKMDMFPDVTVHATRRLLRLLYIQQLSRAVVSPFVPPADTTDVPIVVIVGHEGVGKGTLVRRLASECSSNIELARQHTTALHHFSDHYLEITRQKFDDMLLAGDLLTYSEMAGESYGLSREEAYIKNGKVKIVNMDFVGALMLKLRGYQPYLILATMLDKKECTRKQLTRRTVRENYFHNKRSSVEVPEQETLQVLLSGRIIITGILNEIIMELPEEKERSDFVLESECSLMLDSDERKTMREFTKDPNLIALLNSSNLTIDEVNRRYREKNNNDEQSLHSLFKDSQVDYSSYATNGQGSSHKSERPSKVRYPSVSFSRYASNAKDNPNEKSSKSVTFDNNSGINPSGMIIEAPPTESSDDKMRSISNKAPWPTPGQHAQHGLQIEVNDSDLWLAFLTDAGQKQASEISEDPSVIPAQQSRPEDHIFMMNEIRNQTAPLESAENLESMETLSRAHLREDYESIHRRNPGLFWDMVTTDDPDAAFNKVRNIIRDIMNKQNTLKPMFDIDFTNEPDYPTVQEKMLSIRKQIAPQQLFF